MFQRGGRREWGLRDRNHPLYVGLSAPGGLGLPMSIIELAFIFPVNKSSKIRH